MRRPSALSRRRRIADPGAAGYGPDLTMSNNRQLLAAALAGLTCACISSKPGSSRSCPAGDLLADDTCRHICNIDTDCRNCERCTDGLCYPEDPCVAHPCDTCSTSQVCVSEQCRTACDAMGKCAAGSVCQERGAVPYCTTVSAVRGGAGVAVSRGASFVVRGGVVPVGGVSASPSYRVTVPLP
jgi:hypothetical protein